MTLKKLKVEINKIPSKLDNQKIIFCGELITDGIKEGIKDFEIDWMDCSDAILVFLNKE